jgi:hypothetical protein
MLRTGARHSCTFVLRSGSAATLHMPTSTVEHLAGQGTLPSRKIGRRRLYVRQHVEALLLGDLGLTPDTTGVRGAL